MKIYRSPFPAPPLPRCSAFTFLFNSPDFAALPSNIPAFIDSITGRSISRAQLKDLALQWGYGLLNVFSSHSKHSAKGTKVRRGDTVMIFSPNSLAFPMMLHGAVAAGLRVTLANSSYMSSELAHQYKDSGAKLVFAHPSVLSVAQKMFDEVYGSKGKEEFKRRVIVAGGSGWGSVTPEDEKKFTSAKEWKGLVWMEELLGKGALDAEEIFAGEDSNETAFLCYSSGTTGKPKGVETTHYNMTSLLTMLGPLLSYTPSEDVMLAILPFYHIYGLTIIMHHPIMFSTPVVIMPAFNPEAFCANIEKYKVSVAMVVPPVLVVLASHPVVDKYNLRTVRLLVSGAAPLGGMLVDKVKKKLNAVGVVVDITQGYGLTETTPCTHLLPAADSVRKVGSVGILIPHQEARLMDEDGVDIDESPGGAEEGGELWIRGPNVMKGYLNNPTSTKNTITEDGWLKTGDVAKVDEEGFFWIVDRRKELIKYKGFQVPPAELESLLLQHPDIVDTAVIGVDSAEEATEVPRAYIVHNSPQTILQNAQAKEEFERSVQEWVKGKVAKHKYLRGGVVVIDVIPKSAAGKILRRILRDRAKAELSASITRAKL